MPGRPWIFTALVLVAACGKPQAAPTCELQFEDAGDVRIFAVAHQHHIEDGRSYATYKKSYWRHLAEIRPCLSPDRPNLIVFPEDAALVALLIGSRGKKSREAPDTNIAFALAYSEYGAAANWYQSEYPGISLARSLLLAASDTVWRAVDRTFASMAADTGAWVLTTANVGVVSHTTDPDLVALLGDPDLGGSDGVYVADGPEVYNSALLYGPDGTLVARTNKVFLTDPEEDLLDLSNGRLDQVLVMDTPFARIGPAISRDAWYPPFVERLSDLDASIAAQLEAFIGGWAIGHEQDDEWLPDVFTASGWLHTQKHGSIRYSVAPQMTGNFYELIFDSQLSLAKTALPDDEPMGYIGQDSYPGWVDVEPWVEPDPGTGTLAERRAALREVGYELAPGSGAARENAYGEGVLAADLSLAAEPVEVTRDAGQPVSTTLDATSAAQKLAEVYVDPADRVLVVWQDRRSGTWQIHGARSIDGGVTWEALGALAPGSQNQLRPQLCGTDGQALLVWQEEAAGGPEQARATYWSDLEAAPSAPVGVESAAAAQWSPVCSWVDLQNVVVSWVDFRSGVPRLRYSSGNTALSFGTSAEVDASNADLPRLEGAQLQPAASHAGGDLVWTDYRDRSWDVRYARFDGAVWSASTRIDGVSGVHERLHGEPRVSRSGTQIAATFADLHQRRGHSDVALVVSADDGQTWSPHATVPGGVEELPAGFGGGGGLPRMHPAVAWDAAGRVWVAFQDLVDWKSAVYTASFESPSTFAAPTRFDDSADAPMSSGRPRLGVLSSGARLVVWEDDAQGPRQIRAAVGGTP